MTGDLVDLPRERDDHSRAPSVTYGGPLDRRLTTRRQDNASRPSSIFPNSRRHRRHLLGSIVRRRPRPGPTRSPATFNGFQQNTTLTVSRRPPRDDVAGPRDHRHRPSRHQCALHRLRRRRLRQLRERPGRFDALISGRPDRRRTPSPDCRDLTCTVNLAGNYVVSLATPLPSGGTLSGRRDDAHRGARSGRLPRRLALIGAFDGSRARPSPSAQWPTTRSATSSAASTSSYSYASGGHDVVCPNGTCSPTAAGELHRHRIGSARRRPARRHRRASILTVVPAGVAALSVTPENASTPAGTPVQYAVGGVDAFGNALPDQTAASTVTYTPAGGDSPVVCEDALCGPTAAGLYQVDVFRARSGRARSADATSLSVVPADLDDHAVSSRPISRSPRVTRCPTPVTGVRRLRQRTRRPDRRQHHHRGSGLDGGDPIRLPAWRVPRDRTRAPTSSPAPPRGPRTTSSRPPRSRCTPDVLRRLQRHAWHCPDPHRRVRHLHRDGRRPVRQRPRRPDPRRRAHARAACRRRPGRL